MLRKILSTILVSVVLLIVLAVSVGAVAGTKNESEPNDTLETAVLTKDDYNNYGYISNTSTADFWKVRFRNAGYVNFWLSDIPSGCDYDMAVYHESSSGELECVGYSSNSGTSSELVTVEVVRAQYYYVMIYSHSGYSTTQKYLFRAKVYPSPQLEVPLYAQSTDSTCSSASIRMVVRKFGIVMSEPAIKQEQDNNDGQYEWNSVGGVVSAINSILASNNISAQYYYQTITSYTLADYQDLVLNSLLDGCPIIPLLNINNTNYFHNTTPGHYVVIKGLQYNVNNSKYYTYVNDPHYAYPDIYTNIPISAIRTYNLAHTYDMIIYGET